LSVCNRTSLKGLTCIFECHPLMQAFSHVAVDIRNNGSYLCTHSFHKNDR